MIYRYVYEKLWLAVRWLAITQGSIQERVRDAYVFHLAHIHQIDLPEELRGVLKEIEQKLTKISQLSGKEESIKATVRQMSADEASLIADKIAYLFHQAVEKYYSKASG